MGKVLSLRVPSSDSSLVLCSFILDSTVGRTGWCVFFLSFYRILKFSLLLSFISSVDYFWEKPHICPSDSLPEAMLPWDFCSYSHTFPRAGAMIWSTNLCSVLHLLLGFLSLQVLCASSPKNSKPLFFTHLLSLPLPVLSTCRLAIARPLLKFSLFPNLWVIWRPQYSLSPKIAECRIKGSVIYSPCYVWRGAENKKSQNQVATVFLQTQK